MPVRPCRAPASRRRANQCHRAGSRRPRRCATPTAPAATRSRNRDSRPPADDHSWPATWRPLLAQARVASRGRACQRPSGPPIEAACRSAPSRADTPRTAAASRPGPAPRRRSAAGTRTQRTRSHQQPRVAQAQAPHNDAHDAPRRRVPRTHSRRSSSPRDAAPAADSGGTSRADNRPAMAPSKRLATARPRSPSGTPAAAARSRPLGRTGSRPHGARPRTPPPARDPGRRPAAPERPTSGSEPETARADRPPPPAETHAPPTTARTPPQTPTTALTTSARP